MVGEQPIPNLLPVKLTLPSTVVLLHSELTERTAANLEILVKPAKPIMKKVDAYSIEETEHTLRELIGLHEWLPRQLIFNLTGGTKLMSFGAFRLAVDLKSEALYLRTEKPALVVHYDFAQGTSPTNTQILSTLPVCLDLPTYIEAFRGKNYLVKGDYAKTEPGRSFERAVHQALMPIGDEFGIGLKLDSVVDIDLVIRCHNEVGLIECKVGQNGLKDAIDQINTAGGREYLGTYTQKFIVSNVDWRTKTNLADLASARRIKVISLLDYRPNDTSLSEHSAEILRRKVAGSLGKRL